MAASSSAVACFSRHVSPVGASVSPSSGNERICQAGIVVSLHSSFLRHGAESLAIAPLRKSMADGLNGKRQMLPAISPVSALSVDFDVEESEEDLEAAYKEIYGNPFGAVAKNQAQKADDEDEDVEEPGKLRGRKGARDDDDDDEPSTVRGRGRGKKSDDIGGGKRGESEFEERLVQVRRVTKVVKGGKQLAFRAVIVLGDGKGRVGVGVGKAKEVITAVQKSAVDARRHMVHVPMTKYKTFPHRSEGVFGAAKVMVRPAAPGTGVIAGGAVRVVLEAAGVENALGKQLGSKNPLNNARAVLDAVTKMKQYRDVSTQRGIPMEELWK